MIGLVGQRGGLRKCVEREGTLEGRREVIWPPSLLQRSRSGRRPVISGAVIKLGKLTNAFVAS